MASYKAAAAEGENRLARAHTENAAFEALHLLLCVCGMDRTAYLLGRDGEMPPGQEEAYFGLIERRVSGEPLQYLMRTQDFLGRTYAVGPGVLIPRPETEELAQLCIEAVLQNGYRTVFDLCAGSGCIGYSVALHCPDADVWLFEKYDPALSYLRKNLPDRIRQRVHIVQADVLLPPPQGLPVPDLIVSNPPYIPTAQLPLLQREVLREPVSALDGGEDGLTFYRAVLRHWTPLLRPGGLAAFECGDDQSAALTQLFGSAGAARTVKDAFGADRFVTVNIP